MVGFGKVGGAFCSLLVEGRDVIAGPVDMVADAHCVGAEDSEARRSCLLVEGFERLL